MFYIVEERTWERAKLPTNYIISTKRQTQNRHEVKGFWSYERAKEYKDLIAPMMSLPIKIIERES